MLSWVSVIVVKKKLEMVESTKEARWFEGKYLAHKQRADDDLGKETFTTHATSSWLLIRSPP